MWFKVLLLLVGAVTRHPVLSEGLDVGQVYSCNCSMKYDKSNEVCYVCCCYNTSSTSDVLTTSVCDNVRYNSSQDNGTIWHLNLTQTAASCKSQNVWRYMNKSGERYYSLGKTECNIIQTGTQGSSIWFCVTSKMFGNGPKCFKIQVKIQTGGGDIVIGPVKELLNQSQKLDNSTLPGFLETLKEATVSNSNSITASPANIEAVVEILSNVAERASHLTIPIDKQSMKNILETADILTSDSTKGSWASLDTNDNGVAKVKSAGSSLLNSFEIITTLLVNESLNIETPNILLKKTTFKNTFNEKFNSSVEIDITRAGGGNKSITVILFASMDNVLPARDTINLSSGTINGKVTLIKAVPNINNLSLIFDVINNDLENPKCVFWDFDLFDGLGGWSDKGCLLALYGNKTVTCNCNHTTSFSILMSPDSPNDSLLNSITFIGLGISMASLVICLITEAMLWKTIGKNTTSYLRHISIVNIATSLLIANIWFFIGAGISDVEKKIPIACTIATAFIHFFYLAMFFWMFASALLLLYRTVKVFHGGLSNRSMLVIGFSLGYGAPLIISATTIAVTAPTNEYMHGKDVCWLNWNESKALLAFVVPALSIVVINLFILFVVIHKMLRRKVRANTIPGERHVLMVIARSLAVLTPFFGLTWSLGIGTMIAPKSREMHIAFACSNSMQGFFIWVFGTLIDKKVQSEMVSSLTFQDQ